MLRCLHLQGCQIENHGGVPREVNFPGAEVAYSYHSEGQVIDHERYKLFALIPVRRRTQDLTGGKDCALMYTSGRHRSLQRLFRPQGSLLETMESGHETG